jgi:NADP-dependent 3-hydroxy acid dehydrogenase YdfG
LAITSRKESDLEVVSKEIREINKKILIHTIAADLVDVSAAKKVIESTIQTFSQLDLLVLNAGYAPTSFVADLEFEKESSEVELFKTYQINLFSAIQATTFALPHLRKTNGTIIYISTGATNLVIPGGSTYAGSKVALNYFVSVVAAEEPNVTVLSIGPGIVETAMFTEMRDNGKISEEFQANLRSVKEKGVLLQPEDVGARIAQLSLKVPKDWTGKFILDVNTDDRVAVLLA